MQSTDAFAVANGAGAIVRAGLNADLQALATNSSGTGAPASPYPHQLWLDTTNNVIKKRNAGNTAWIAWAYFDETNNQVIPFVGGGQTTIASAATCDLGSKNQSSLNITGTVGIASFGTTMQAGQIKLVTFAAALILTQNATSMILPGGVDITTTAGDMAIVECLATGNYQLKYFPISGSPVGKLPAGSVIQTVFANYNTQVDTSSATPIATGLTATITPKYASSKIKITVVGNFYNIALGGEGTAGIYRATSALETVGQMYSSNADYIGQLAGSYLDSPATTAPVTYNLYFAAQAGTFRSNPSGAESTMVLEEIQQ